jgi:hypothetical protein
MTVFKKPPLAPASAGAKFPDTTGSDGIATKHLRGRKVIFLTDERDLRFERVVLPHLFERVGADGTVLSYPDFFSEAGKTCADILILRSSRIFSYSMDELVRSLGVFRQNNPKSAVIICSYDQSVAEKLLSLLDGGIINAVESRPPEDISLMFMGEEIFGRLQ